MLRVKHMIPNWWDLEVWMQDQLQGQVSIKGETGTGYESWWFTHESDAIVFRLTWGELIDPTS